MIRRGYAAVLLVMLFVSSGGIGASGQDTPSRLPGAYLTALASYRAGDLAAAFGKLRALDAPAFAEINKTLLRGDVASGASWARLLTAAMLLHTEAFIIRAEAGPAFPSDPYILSARSLARHVLRLADDGQQGFGAKERTLVRNWYLLLVSMQHGRADMGWSRAYLAEAMQAFPNDPNLTLALGSDHEMVSDISKGYLNHVDVLGRFRRQDEVDAGNELRDAIRYLERAVALEPKMMEARLRLGRVLYRRGDLEKAAQELDAALQLAPRDELRYLALVFRGRVEAARGNFERADAIYSDAIRVLPKGQVAVIAKAEAAYLGGRASEAAAMVQAMLQLPEKGDPWWLYISGEWWHFEYRLEWIRNYVQQ